MINNDSQNLDQLSEDALALIAYTFDHIIVGFDYCHAIEIRLDDPMKNLIDGGKGLVAHGGNWNRCYIQHYGDPKWAIIHWQDPAWNALPHKELLEKGFKLFKEINK